MVPLRGKLIINVNQNVEVRKGGSRDWKNEVPLEQALTSVMSYMDF